MGVPLPYLIAIDRQVSIDPASPPGEVAHRPGRVEPGLTGRRAELPVTNLAPRTSACESCREVIEVGLRCCPDGHRHWQDHT